MSLDNIQLDIIVTLQGSQAIRNAVSQLNDVSRAANSVRERSQAVRSVNLSQIKSWDDLREGLAAVEQKYDAVYRAGMHLTMMGQGLVSISEKIIRTGMGIVNTYEGYDLMLRRGAVALNTNEKWQRKLDSAIQKTAQTIGLQNPEEVAEGYYIWGAAAGMVVDSQKELDQITEVVQKTMIATAMAGGTLEGNLNGVYGVLSQFNMPMERAGEVTEILALMTERTAAQFPDLINSLSYIGPLADQLGVKFEDVTSILGLLADAGQKGSRAGRGLAMIIEGLSAPSGPAGEALDGLIQRTHGLSAAWEDVVFPKGEFIGMRDMLIEMALAAEDMTDAERGRFFATAFTNNATRALIPLVKDQIELNKKAAASGKKITSVLDQQKYATDGAAHFFEIMKEKALDSITAIKGRLEAKLFPTLQIMAKTIMKMALPTIEWLGDMALKFARFLKQNPQLVKFAVRVAAFGAAITAAAGVVFLLAGAVVTLIANMGNFFMGIGRVLGPFALLIGLFVAFGVAVWNNVRGIKDAIKNFVDAVADFWSALAGDGEEFKDIWTGMWDAVREAAETAVGIIADVLNTLADGLRAISENETAMGFIRGAVGVFIRFKTVLTTGAAAWAAIWAIGRAIRFLVAALKILSGYSMLAGMIRALAGAFVLFRAAVAAGGIVAGIQALAAMMGGPLLLSIVSVTIALGPILLIIAGVAAAIALLALAWENNWFGIRDIVANVVNFFTQTLFPLIGEWVAGVIQFFADLGSNVIGFIGQVIEFVGQLPGKIAEWFTSIAETMLGFISSIPGKIVEGIQWLVDNIGYLFGLLVGNIIGFFLFLVVKAVKFGVDFVGGIIDWIAKLPGRVANWFGTLWNNLSAWFGTAVPTVGGWAGDIVTGIVDWVIKLPGRVMEWFGTLWDNLSTWFIELVPKVSAWMQNVIEKILDWFAKLPGRAITAVGDLVGMLKDFFVKLPGRIWDALLGLGGAIVEGLWKGISDLAGWFGRQVEGFVKGIIDGVAGWLGIASPSKVFADFGQYMVQGLAVGIDKDHSAVTALRRYTDDLMGVAARTNLGISAGLEGAEAGISVNTDGTKRLLIELDLKSSDGSISDSNLEQLKAVLTGSDLVRALERMAEAG